MSALDSGPIGGSPRMPSRKSVDGAVPVDVPSVAEQGWERELMQGQQADFRAWRAGAG